MALLIKDEAHHMLLELWAEHTLLSLGYRPKVFQHPIPSHFFSHKNGKTFYDTKPWLFKVVDEFILNRPLLKEQNGKFYQDGLDLIEYADRRMGMGDYRYGPILRQNLDNYDTAKEFSIRIELARENKSLEYAIDAYNMTRIQFLKDECTDSMIDRASFALAWYFYGKHRANWSMDSIDDGHHATEKS